MPESRIEVNGADLWTATDGSGRPLVLCHGGPGGWHDLGDVAGMLEDLATVHRYDQRACGRSSGSNPATMADLVEELDALREHWGHERWIVGGHSHGAALAHLYAATYPERAEAVIYLDGTGLSWSDHRAAYREAQDARLTPEQRAERDRLGALLEGLEATAGDEYRSVHDAYCRLVWSTDFAASAADPERALELADRLLRHGPLANFEVNRRVNADWNRMRADPQWRARLAAVDCPVLVVHGAGDPRPLAAVAELIDLLPDARLEVIEDAGHYPWMEQPDAVRAVLRDFVRSVPLAPSAGSAARPS